MMAHPLALQLRNLQSLVEIAVDKNTTVVFPPPLMSTIGGARRLPRPRSKRGHRHTVGARAGNRSTTRSEDGQRDAVVSVARPATASAIAPI
jgi:hypothetical protein